MVKISLFKVGLIAMLFFVFASNILNYVSIATYVWAENAGSASLWYQCNNPNENNVNPNNARCFKDNPAALIATGTALNCLSLVLIAIAQISICNKRIRDSIGLYFVIGALLGTLLSLVFNTTGWYFTFNYQYLNTNKVAYNYGWSFWLMTPSFACSVIAGLIGSAILGCTCVTNKYERERREQEKLSKISSAYIQHGGSQQNLSNNQATTIYYPADHSNDPQVLRL